MMASVAVPPAMSAWTVRSNASRPRLSVVTVTYNDPAGLRQTLHSLQPLSEAWAAEVWEHLVIDAAPGISRPVLDALTDDWPLIHLERPPRGVADAFNQGLSAARGTYLWFLNGGDELRDLAVLVKLLTLLDCDLALDFVCAGAYLYRETQALYPIGPRRTLLGNLIGRSWMCQQAIVYRRDSLERVGAFSTEYRVTGDYDFHLRCLVAGLRGRFTSEPMVNYDMGGGSNNVAVAFAEFKQIQRAQRAALPMWVVGANELVRTVEYGRIRVLRILAATRLGRRLRPAWAKFRRAARPRRAQLTS